MSTPVCDIIPIMCNEILLRAAQEKDVAAINDILNEAIKNSCSNWAWTERSYEKALEWFNNHDCGKYCIFVAESDGVIAGYASLSEFRNREGYWPVVENSVYIHKDFRRKKIGTMLMKALIGSARENDVKVISAWIDSQNLESIEMHKKFDFYVTGEMRNVGEKFAQRRSVTIMQLDL